MILSDKDEAKYPAGALVNAAEVAKAGGTFNEAYALNKGEAYGGIALSDLSSCKYVKPGHVDAEAELFYVDLSEFADAIPGAAAKPQVIPAVGTCAGATCCSSKPRASCAGCTEAWCKKARSPSRQ